MLFTRKYAYDPKVLEPVAEWIITAELINYQNRRKEDLDLYGKPYRYMLDFRLGIITEREALLTPVERHDMKIDSVRVRYQDKTLIFYPHASYEDNIINKDRAILYSLDKKKYLERERELYTFSNWGTGGHIPPEVKTVQIIAHGTIKRKGAPEEAFTRIITTQLYEHTSISIIPLGK